MRAEDIYQATAKMPYAVSFRCRKCGAITSNQLDYEYETEVVSGKGTHEKMRKDMEARAWNECTEHFADLCSRVNGDAFTVDDIPWLGNGACTKCGHTQPWGKVGTDERLSPLFRAFIIVFRVIYILGIIGLFLVCRDVKAMDARKTGYLICIAVILVSIAICLILKAVKRSNLKRLRSEGMSGVAEMKANHEEACLPRIGNRVDEKSTDERILALNKHTAFLKDISIEVRSWDTSD